LLNNYRAEVRMGEVVMPKTCKETIRMICEYLEGKLSGPVSAAMRCHLSGCQNCRLVHEAASKTLEIYFDKDYVPGLLLDSHRAKVA
jgi:hypothetical protein